MKRVHGPKTTPGRHRQVVLGSLRLRRNGLRGDSRVDGGGAQIHFRAGDRSSGSRPELVVCIVSALGSNIEPVMRALREALKAVDYDTRDVRVSDLLEAASGLLGTPRSKKTTRTRWLMDLGDSLREAAEMGSAAICLAALEISASRLTDPFVDPDRGDRPGVVTIIRSAKRDDEIQALRQVYGSRLLVLGVSAAESERRDHLLGRLRAESIAGSRTGMWGRPTA